MGLGKKKEGKERIFGGSDSGERRSRRRFRWGITAPVPVEGESGCRWRENGFGGKFLEGWK
jgi:hypothetical protein